MKTNIKSRLAVVVVTTALALAGIGQTRAAQLVQYWPFDDGGGGTATNAVAGGNTGQLVNADTGVAWTTDHPAQLGTSVTSVAADGVDDYLNLGNLRLKGSGTISVWVKPANFDAGDIRLFSQVPYVSPYAGVARIDPFTSGNIEVNGGGPWLNLGTADQIPPGSWSHLAFVFDDGIARLYINGVRLSGSAVTGFDFDAAGFGLGARFDLGGAIGGPIGNAYSGLFDDVSVWNGPLSSSSIALLANGTLPTAITDIPDLPPAAELVQYFPFDDGTGSSTATNGVAAGLTGQLVNSDPNSSWSTDRPPLLSDSAASVSFDGVDDYVNLGNFGLKGEGTISLWIKPTTVSPTGNGIRLYSHVTTPASFAGIVTIGLLPSGVIVSGNVVVYDNGWREVASPQTLVANTWTHLAFVHAPGKCTLYINGEPYQTVSAGFDFDAADFGLGARFALDGALGGPLGLAYGGLIDDFSLWNHALQPSSIGKLARGQKPTSIVDSPATEPPFIFQHPASQTVVATFPVTMSVVARGAGALTYQWRQGPTPIAGTHSNSLTLAAAQAADAGAYTVVVENSFGSVTSRVATLTVDPGVPVIASQPASVTQRLGAPASFTVSATGAQPLEYQWRRNNAPILDATSFTYSLASIVNGDAGNYTVVVNNSAGAVTSQVAVLSLLLTPAAVNVDLAFDAATYVYVGTAAAPDPGTAWNLVLQTEVDADPNGEKALVNSDGAASAIKFFSNPFPITGGYTGGGNLMQETYWHVGAAATTPEFGFRNLDPGTKYDVYVYGIGQDFGTGFTEQFNRVGGDSKPLDPSPSTGSMVPNEDFVLFAGITGVSEVAFTAGNPDPGTVFSTVSGLQIIQASEAPRILSQPVGGLQRVGGTIMFSVGAVGSEPLDYQWYHHGSEVIGAFLSILTIDPIQTTDAGDYWVVVSNPSGAATSHVAQLTLQIRPAAVNVNLIRVQSEFNYSGFGAAPDLGTVWNNLIEDTLAADPNREALLTDSDGNSASVLFFSGSFGAPLGGNFGHNGGGNDLQTTYWHVGAGNLSPEFGFRGLDPQKTYEAFVYGIAIDFGTGIRQRISLVGGASKPLNQLPDTGFPIEGEDFVRFAGITGVSHVAFTAGQAGATVFSTVTGLQIQEVVLPPVLSIARSGNQVTISWTGNGTLEYADNVDGVWGNTPDQNNPQTAAASAARKFYRVRQ